MIINVGMFGEKFRPPLLREGPRQRQRRFRRAAHSSFVRFIALGEAREGGLDLWFSHRVRWSELGVARVYEGIGSYTERTEVGDTEATRAGIDYAGGADALGKRKREWSRRSEHQMKVSRLERGNFGETPKGAPETGAPPRMCHRVRRV